MSATSDLVPSTEVEAINEILSTIGEAAVLTLDDTGDQDVALALQKLRTVSRQFQASGWTFNTDREFEISRDGDGYIYYPSDALRMTPARSEHGIRGVKRGARLYDSTEHTFVWERDIKVDVIRFLTFADMPEAARMYITIAAGRQFARAALGSGEVESMTKADEQRAWVALRRDENRQAKLNVFTAPALAYSLNREPTYSFIR
jgi:hypothetical protein